MAPGDYLRGVLADGARPFRYRAGVRELLGVPDDTGVPVSFGARMPAAAFAYLRATDAFPVEDAPPEWLAAPDSGWFDEPGTANTLAAPGAGPPPQSTVDTLLTIPGSTPRPAGDAHRSALPDRRPDAVGPPVTAAPPDPGDGVAGPVPAQPGRTGSGGEAGRAAPAEASGPGLPGVVPAGSHPTMPPRWPDSGRTGSPGIPAGGLSDAEPAGAPPRDTSARDARPERRGAATGAGTGAGTGSAGAGAPADGTEAVLAEPLGPSGGMPRRGSGALPRGTATGARFTGTGSGPSEPGALTGPGALSDAAALGAASRDAAARDATARDAAALGGADIAAGPGSAATPSTANPPRGRPAVRPIPTTAPTRSSRPVPAQQVQTPDPGAPDSGTGESDAFEPPYRRTGERRRAAPQSPAAPEPPATPPAAPPAQVVVIRQAAPPVVTTAAFWERRHVGRLRARILR